ncbi:hypothetical protein [Bacteroides sp.]|uniref:hypothetical protein n=1 Tax=Bacteroides sp. TaxID=29523 RepID=UPI00262C7CBE|nr:hypothetical protein [Bacteroides sp.]MDD3039554.1 hypothetical protein [Bacteroides sp.]
MTKQFNENLITEGYINPEKIDDYLARNFREFLAPITEETFEKSAVSDEQVKIDIERLGLQKVSDVAYSFSIPKREMQPIAICTYKTVSALELQQFELKRSQLLKALSEVKECRRLLISEKHVYNNYPVIRELKEVKRLLKGLDNEIEIAPKTGSKRRNEAEMESMRQLYKQQTEKFRAVYESRISCLEAVISEDYDIQLQTAVIESRKIELKRLDEKLRRAKKWFSEYQIPKTRTAAVTCNGRTVQCNLVTRVSAT